MIRTVEAVVDESGTVRLLEEVRLPGARRALVTILEEPPIIPNEAALLSEAALSDWNRPEEEAAWSHLQPAAASFHRGWEEAQQGEIYPVSTLWDAGG